MELAKARQLQEDLVESFVLTPVEDTRHFRYMDERSNRPYKNLKIDLAELVNGAALVPVKEGWGVKLYTEGNVSANDLAGYFGRKPGDFFVDNIGAITILSQPCPGNYICYPKGSVGTLGAYVQDNASKPYVLSNNHVLSNFCTGKVGDNIVHPGHVDTGHNVIARVSKLLPIDFSATKNEIDCGLAELVGFPGPNSALPGVGKVPGTIAASYGMKVEKTGHKTFFTTGIVNSVAAIVKVDYGSGFFRRKLATFRDQIEIKPNHPHPLFSDVGDSGSLLTESGSGKATGLIFAGSTNGTGFANPIKKVLGALFVQIL